MNKYKVDLETLQKQQNKFINTESKNINATTTPSISEVVQNLNKSKFSDATFYQKKNLNSLKNDENTATTTTLPDINSSTSNPKSIVVTEKLNGIRKSFDDNSNQNKNVKIEKNKIEKEDNLSSIISSYLALDKKNQNENKVYEINNHSKSLNSRNKEIKLKVREKLYAEILILKIKFIILLKYFHKDLKKWRSC